VFDLVCKARGVDMAGALAFVREKLGVVSAPMPGNAGSSRLPELRPGSSAELSQLARIRGLHVKAVEFAMDRGFLHFGTLWRHAFWAVTDQRRSLVEFRRLDGKLWPAFRQLAERKSHCRGSGKDWPVGTLESAPYTQIAWLEGAPDFLAFWHFARIEKKAETVAPVGMLGAANRRIAGDALQRFSGKSVTLYPHQDTAGHDAAQAWARQLRDAGAAVMAFDLSGIEKDDGTMGKDLNDLCFMSADCFERAENVRFQEVLP
jgi:hypothetical protein